MEAQAQAAGPRTRTVTPCVKVGPPTLDDFDFGLVLSLLTENPWPTREEERKVERNPDRNIVLNSRT